MGKEELIVCFQNTLEISKKGTLGRKTSSAIKSNRVYKEGFVSSSPKRQESATVIVCAGTTFLTAGEYRSLGKIAVLNFANPEYPGGGVSFGAMAQEECLCRSSNLYACISDSNVYDEYYLYHRNLKNHFYSDRLIYTKNVTVFKSDQSVPQLLSEEKWFDVDVITCAAPYLGQRKYTNAEALFALFKGRIKNIFEAARDNHIDVIVLGAFGCGAFKNPPKLVAQAFREVIREENYLKAFKQIVFAIKPTGVDCPNLREFTKQLECFAPEAREQCTLIAEGPKGRFYKTPIFLKNVEGFHGWQGGNKYFGKQFSILGDSISTLEGYNPKGYNVFYSGDNCVKSGVEQMSDTWWDKIISFLGGELLVNNSWSGSRVTKIPQSDQLFPSGCSNERTSALHINNVKPDVIIVYLGTNDWGFGARIGNDISILGEDDNERFVFAYENMLRKLKNNYPNSEIWCCTLCETYISKQPNFHFPHKHGGTHIEEYNDIIRKAVRKNKCHLIDLYSYKMPYDSIDGSHPTSGGMDTIATMVLSAMTGQESDMFFDCVKFSGENMEPFYSNVLPPVDEETSVLVDDNVTVNSEYVMLDPNITTMLYSNTLKLTIENTGKTVQFQKDVVTVGKRASCDLLLDSKKYVSRQHATFFYEHKTWFLRDDFSTNGTWINGARILPGKKYQLAANDEINFATDERIFFYKLESNEEPVGDPDAKSLAFLEAGMSAFAQSDHTDEDSLKLILAALSDAPLYFPVEIDLEAMIGSADPTKLKPGDTLQPEKDVKMRILTLTPESGIEFVPMFTSNDEVNKGPSVSIISLYPQDYLPKLIRMDKPVIINPFSENRFLLSKQLITEVLFPLVQNKTVPNSTVEQSSTDKYVGQTIGGKYEILKLIGRGGFYTTYLVKDVHLNKIWAMKVCDKKHRDYSPVTRQIILTELYMIKKLDHPAIPKVVDFSENEDCIFIVRDYVEGETLETIVTTFGAQPADKVIEWSKQLCDVLTYLHSLTPPHIYRDMKPANVILKPDGTTKIIDFGIMRTYKHNKNCDTCCLGTMGYAAPEQHGGSQTDARTDIYGLGMTMFHLVTGTNPIETQLEIKPICMINPSLPKGLEYIISKCIQMNPDERYQTCEELLADLNNYLSLPKPKGILSKLFGKK